jgi:hypothetical protein
MNVLDLNAEDILNRIDVRLDEYKAAAEEAARLESAFKAWEASRRVAIIDAGKSATYATDAVRAEHEWGERYMEMELAKIEAEHVKAKVGQGIRYLEIWRSKYASERRATQ